MLGAARVAVMEGGGVEGVAQRFMSHTKWCWWVRERAAGHLSRTDFRTVWQKMEEGRTDGEEPHLSQPIANRGFIQDERRDERAGMLKKHSKCHNVTRFKI